MKRLIVFVFVLFLFASFGTAALDNSSLSVYFPFDDVSGNFMGSIGDNELIANGTFSYSQAGKISDSTFFDETSSWARDYSTAWLPSGVNDNFTVALWTKLNGSLAGDGKIFVIGDYADGGCDNTGAFYLGTPTWAANDIYSGYSFDDWDTNLDGDQFLDDAWHQWVISRNASVLKIYVDGVLLATDSSRSGDICGSRPYITINKHSQTNNQGHVGNYDAFMIFNKTLTDGNVADNETATGEIADLYNLGDGWDPFPAAAGDTLNITATKPETGTNFSINDITLNITLETLTSANCSLYINSSLEQTVTGMGNSTTIFNETLDDGNYDYNFFCDNGVDNETSSTKDFQIDSIDINPTYYPLNSTQWNEQTISFNLTVNSTSSFTCDLNFDGTLNSSVSKSAGDNVFAEINVSFDTTERTIVFDWNCSNTYGSEATVDNHTIFYDVISPAIIWYIPLNLNTTTLNLNSGTNLTANISINDPNLYSYYYNISSSTTVLFNFSNTSLTGLTTATINHVVNLENYTGELFAWIKVCDGHTSQLIGDLNPRIESNELKIEEISVYLESKSNTKDIYYKKLNDRYNFDFTTKTSSTVQEFIVESPDYIKILHGKTEYAGHLVSGNKWIDFEMDGVTVKVVRINDNKVKIITTSKFPIKEWSFNSIGELNCIEQTRSFWNYNITTAHTENVSILSTNPFYLNITPFDSDYMNITNVTLNYNGTAYSGSGSLGIYNVNVIAPYSLTDYNMTFNWSYAVGTTTYTTSNEKQNVFSFQIDNCSSFGTRVINITIYNESNNELYNATINAYLELWQSDKNNLTSFNISLTGNNTYGICINPAFASYQSYLQLDFIGTGFEKKLYYWANNTLNATSQELKLYLTDGTTQVSFTVTDQNDNPIEDAYIKILSYDLGTNSYKTTEILKTDSDGVGLGQILLNTQWYQFIIEYEEEVQLTSTPTKITTTAKNFRINTQADFFDRYTNVRGVTSTLTFNNATNNFVFTWSDASGTIHNACLKVIKRSINGDTLINDTCTISTSGTILSNIGNDTGTYTYLATSYLKYDEVFFLGSLSKTFNEVWKSYGTSGLFGSFMLITSLIAVGVWSPIIAVLLMLVGVVITNIWGIFHLGWEILIAFIIVGGIAIYKLSR